MSEKLSNNLQINLIITSLIGILGFILNKYFAEYLGLETLGLMKLFTQMIAYLSLAELGIGSAASFALYKPLLQKDLDKINLITSTLDFFYNKIASIILGVGIVLSVIIPYFIKFDSYNKIIYLYWILYVINTSLGYCFAKYTILFTANQEYGYVRKIQGICKIIIQIIQIICIIKFNSFFIFIVLMILENLFIFYFFYIHYKKEYFYIEKVKKKEKNIIKDMKSLFWHKIGALVVHNTDYIILSKYISLSVVGIYSSYLMIYQILMTVINVITPVITPKIGIFITQNSKNEIYQFWKMLQTVYFYISTVLIICTYHLIEPFIVLWLGKEFLLPKITIILILINLFINLTKIITDTFKFASGFFEDTYAPALESIINLIFSLILVKKIGLNGVIIGTLISNVLILVLLKPILVFRNCFNKNIFEFIKDNLKLLILTGLSIVITDRIFFIINIKSVVITTWNDFFKQSFFLGGLSGIIVFMIFILDSKFKYFCKLLLEKFKRS